MKVLQINTTYNIGSTGRIVAGIDNVLQNAGHVSYVAFGYGNVEDRHHFRIVNRFEAICHNVLSRFTDGQGLFSQLETKKLLRWMDDIQPDVVHLHNLHGNYVNYPMLFKWLQNSTCKVVWTLHDCWPFTGHCAYFDTVQCLRWKDGCRDCQQYRSYPMSFFVDHSKKNWHKKKELFTSLGERLVLVPCSEWLGGLLRDSFFENTKIEVVHNGINISNFCIRKKTEPACNSKVYVLGVAPAWAKRKGLDDMMQLRKLLPDIIDMVLVGLTLKQLSRLPKSIIGKERVDSVEELAQLYSGALALVNPTYEDNYPTVNLEAEICGTPVITYRTGGSPESVPEDMGVVVRQGDVNGLYNAVLDIYNNPSKYNSERISRLARCRHDENLCFQSYLKIYEKIWE